MKKAAGSTVWSQGGFSTVGTMQFPARDLELVVSAPIRKGNSPEACCCCLFHCLPQPLGFGEGRKKIENQKVQALGFGRWASKSKPAFEIWSVRLHFKMIQNAFIILCEALAYQGRLALGAHTFLAAAMTKSFSVIVTTWNEQEWPEEKHRQWVFSLILYINL